MELGSLNKDFKKIIIKIDSIKTLLNIDGLNYQLGQLTYKINQSDFWILNQAEQQKTMQVLSQVNQKLADYKKLIILQTEINSAFELLEIETSIDIQLELQSNLTTIDKLITELELTNLLNEEFDQSPAILAINPGAGGVESQDWAIMLLRMYQRWAESKKFNTELIDINYADEAGIKSCIFQITGNLAYGLLKYETGVHRLVRISPFDSAKRRHTSFASVAVTPLIDDSIAVEIFDKDLKIDTLRSSGAGGQHVNTTESAVRITHLPTGLVVKSQAERSQHKNKEIALKILKSNIYQQELTKKKLLNKASHEQKKEIDFGSQIRSYVLYPYQLVKDHRSGFQTSQSDLILDGKLDIIIHSVAIKMNSSI